MINPAYLSERANQARRFARRLAPSQNLEFMAVVGQNARVKPATDPKLRGHRPGWIQTHSNGRPPR